MFVRPILNCNESNELELIISDLVAYFFRVNDAKKLGRFLKEDEFTEIINELMKFLQLVYKFPKYDTNLLGHALEVMRKFVANPHLNWQPNEEQILLILNCDLPKNNFLAWTYASCWLRVCNLDSLLNFAEVYEHPKEYQKIFSAIGIRKIVSSKLYNANKICKHINSEIFQLVTKNLSTACNVEEKSIAEEKPASKEPKKSKITLQKEDLKKLQEIYDKCLREQLHRNINYRTKDAEGRERYFCFKGLSFEGKDLLKTLNAEEELITITNDELYEITLLLLSGYSDGETIQINPNGKPYNFFPKKENYAVAKLSFQLLEKLFSVDIFPLFIRHWDNGNFSKCLMEFSLAHSSPQLDVALHAFDILLKAELSKSSVDEKPNDEDYEFLGNYLNRDYDGLENLAKGLVWLRKIGFSSAENRTSILPYLDYVDIFTAYEFKGKQLSANFKQSFFEILKSTVLNEINKIQNPVLGNNSLFGAVGFSPVASSDSESNTDDANSFHTLKL